ncbi:MAG TPA: ATP citrate lyase citrate-binding domain-containing protein [Candidatus Saccharimonadales bacterium]|nr:ATP citrate lyase citrate-binding domain-containing protein [Candidatus Saccharimonadales bacterium]
MPRKKLSEVRAKTLLHNAAGVVYEGRSIDTGKDIAEQLQGLNASASYVVKVDQAVKGRYKKGLVKLDVPYDQLATELILLKAQGYRWLMLEPHLAHSAAEERYLQLSRDQDGMHIAYSTEGGVNIEQNADSITRETLSDQTDWATLAQKTGVHESLLRKIVHIFTREYLTFLEINPFVRLGQTLYFLDAAAEVDDAGTYFAKGWTPADFRTATLRSLTTQEQAVQKLNETSPASFNFTVLNPNGSIFLLLSGGGASVAVADEVYATKHGDRLANYGEYSGNPSTDETYRYTTAMLQALLASTAPRKVLFVGGAVANFTDIMNTFSGIIKAIDELSKQLKAQDVKVYVRRGGPRQQEGLALMAEALKTYGLFGAVHGPEMPLIAAIDEAMEAV